MLDRLLKAARTLSPHAAVEFHPASEVDVDIWTCRVVVSNAFILFESEPDTVDVVIATTLKKLSCLSQRVLDIIAPE